MSEKIRIMIVDDEERFLNTLGQRLRLRDFDVTTFSRANEAVEAVRKEEFDIVLLDLKMPGMTGEEVLEIIKRDHPLTEVIILTGHGSIPSAVQCTQSGSYSYLQKPCETDELLEVLKNAYRKRVQNQMRIGQEKMEKLLDLSSGESPLGILRRLKDIEKGKV